MAKIGGGGVYGTDSLGPIIYNNTVAANEVLSGGCGLMFDSSNPDIRNCIVWESYEPAISGCIAHYSDLSDSPGEGTGNISQNPLFVDDVIFHLSCDSPCRDMGTSTVMELVTDDIDGQPRPLQNVANSQVAEFDMGYDEFFENVPPSVDADQDVSANVGEALTLSAEAEDNCDDLLSFEWSEGNTILGLDNQFVAHLDVGIHRIVVQVYDDFGNFSSDEVIIAVVDNVPPVISCPADTTVSATSSSTPVTFTATATDNVDANPTVTCTPASGSGFPVGTTTVTVTATDAAGNGSQCSFTVTVVDDTDPVISCPADKRVSAASSSTLVTYTATATDNMDENPVVTCTPASGSGFPVGTTTVTVTATDESGNGSQCSFTVTVVDDTAPVINCPANKTVSATGSSTEVTYTVTATDNVDATPTVTCTPASGSGFPVGTTTVTVTATDAAGKSSQCSFTVTVKKKSVITTSQPLWNPLWTIPWITSPLNTSFLAQSLAPWVSTNYYQRMDYYFPILTPTYSANWYQLPQYQQQWFPSIRWKN
jgi:hypothetical protein